MLTLPRFAGTGTIKQGWTYEHDILGNRTRRNASTNNHAHPMRYDWDVLNRATLIAQPTGGAGYAYRADGQRIEKVEGITFSWSGSRESGQYDTNYAQNRPTSRYYYDGQMGFEDDYNPSGTVTQVNRYALGARGIDRIARTESGNTTLAYPMYDGHGNMRALLTRDGTGYDTGNWKTYDVWGSVRSGGSSADPKQGYVASIGHVSDSESSLIYMRARFYEPATGRFLSEDPAMDATNWYVYCASNPCNAVDVTGKTLNFFIAYLHLSYLQARTMPTFGIALTYFESSYDSGFIDFHGAQIRSATAYQAQADAAFASGNVRAGEYANAKASEHFGMAKLIQVLGPMFRRLYIELLRLDFLMGDDKFKFDEWMGELD